MSEEISLKTVKSLREKKYRESSKKFLVEGEKNVTELLGSSLKVQCVFTTREFVDAHKALFQNIKTQIVESGELNVIGTFETNNTAIAVVYQPIHALPQKFDGITMVLDDIRDPGNLGTLIRIADWYGVKNIVCSKSTVEWYNPKVVSATMGSFTRVTGYYVDLPNFFAEFSSQKLPILGGCMEGKSTHTFSFPKEGFLVIGSESHGISKEVMKLLTEKITIPKFGAAESLNAAISGAIMLDRWKSKA